MHSLFSHFVIPSGRKRPYFILAAGLFLVCGLGMPVAVQAQYGAPPTYSTYPPQPYAPYSYPPYSTSPYPTYPGPSRPAPSAYPPSRPAYQGPSAYPPSASYGPGYGGSWNRQPQPAPPAPANGYGGDYNPTNGAMANDDNSQGNLDEYARYAEEGSRLFSAGQLTKSIEQFEKALPLAPEGSLSAVYNNLAVVYIKRGNYYHDHQRQDDNALSDFRKAFFYLEPAWPEGEERKPLHAQNRQVARENLTIAYRNLGINAADKAKHLELARQLRLQGKFQEAIVEYALALELDKRDPVATKALGDLFTVVNMPVKSKKYYAMAAGESEAAAATPAPAQGGASATKGPEAFSSGGTAGGSQADILVQLGNAQFKTGEVDKAVSSFDKALEINPNHLGALNMLEKIWKDELGFNPTSVTAHANLGSVYQKKRQFEQALQQYNAAEHFADADPKTAFDVKKQIRLNLGTLFQAQKRYDLALKAYDTVLQVDPNNLTANLYKAALQEETGNTPGAMQTYDKILSIDPGNRTVQGKLLALIKGQSDPAKLADGLKQYADRFANNATVQAQIGEEFHQRKDLANAAIYYQRAIKLDPKLASVWANLGALYEAQGKPDESAEAFRKAQALDPANTTFKQLAKNADSERGEKLYADAVALQQQGKTQEALGAFQQALAINDTAEIRAAYGVALQSAGQLDVAIAEYRKAIAKAPKEADYVYSLGTAYHQKKDFINAESAYKSAIALKPGYAEAEQALAALRSETASAELESAIDAYNKQQYSAALTRVDQALGKNPQDAMAHYYRGLILDGQKKPALAAQSYREAIRHNPEFSDAYYALGVALDSTKDPNGARLAFEKFLTLSKSASASEKSASSSAVAAGTTGSAADAQPEDDFVKYARERVKALAKQ